MENQPVDDSEHPNHTPEWSPLREPTVAQRASERKSKDLSGVAIKIVAVFLVLLVAQQFWNSLVVVPNRNRLFENQLREIEKRLRENEKSHRREITSAATGMKLVLIPAGEFMMGSKSADIDRLVKDFSNAKLLHEEFEKPSQHVEISRSFSMMALGCGQWPCCVLYIFTSDVSPRYFATRSRSRSNIAALVNRSSGRFARVLRTRPSNDGGIAR